MIFFLILVAIIAVWYWYNWQLHKTKNGTDDLITGLYPKRKERIKYKGRAMILLLSSLITASDYAFGHLIFASGDMDYTPSIRDIVTMLSAILFSIYGFIFIYLYKH